jgi:hypothetical protein
MPTERSSTPNGWATDWMAANWPIPVALPESRSTASDYVGRRTAILWGVGASLVGTLLFALAPDVLWLSSKIYDLSEKNADPPKEVGKKVQTRDFCSRAAFAAALERFLERP